MNATQTIARSNLRVKPLVACLLLPLAIGDFECTSVFTANRTDRLFATTRNITLADVVEDRVVSVLGA